MKIRQIEFIDHPILGSQHLDFLDASGNPFPNIVLAGANGTGKTAILDAIFQFLGGQPKKYIGQLKATFSIDSTDVKPLAEALQIHESVVGSDLSIVYTLHLDTAYDHNAGIYQIEYKGANRSASAVPIVFRNSTWGRVFRCFYSVASVDFAPEELRNVTNLGLDASTEFAQKSQSTLATEISQLLADLSSADAIDFQRWARENPGAPVDQRFIDVRVRRFQAAFSSVFPKKKFVGIQNNQRGFTPHFEEFGRVTSISDLSTGEKQIVFRAGFLLRNLKVAQGSIVLVDEPELSLHPEWQQKIVEFYGALLTDEAGCSAQIITATHSPFIVHGTPNAKVVILERDPVDGKISFAKKGVFPTSGSSEARSAFNIDSFIDSARSNLLVLVEGETDRQILLAAWGKLRPGKPRIFDVTASLGNRNTNVTLGDGMLGAKLGKRKVVGIFDFDSAYAQWNGLWNSSGSSTLVQSSESLGLCKKRSSVEAWAMLLPVPPSRSTFASASLAEESILSIEFLFSDQVLGSILQNKTIAAGAQQPYIIPRQKSSFANSVEAIPVGGWVNFEPLLISLEAIASGGLR